MQEAAQKPFCWLEIMWANMAFLCGSSCACWANSSQLYRMKLAHPRACAWLLTGCCGLARLYQQGTVNSLQWANARSCLEAILLAWNNVGQYSIFVWQLMCLLGQFEPIIQMKLAHKGLRTITYGLLWAISSSSAEGHGIHILGQTRCRKNWPTWSQG